MVLTNRYKLAVDFAITLHASQKRKGTNIPYISHLMSVSALVLEQGGDEDEAIAGLLHDAIEDRGGDSTRQEIRRRFGDRVTEIVDGCTDTDADPKPEWLERKKAYVAHIATASASVRLVSAADKLHNARTILSDYRNVGETLWTRFTGGREGTLWYYRALVDEFRAFGSTALVVELELTVAELERLTNMNN